LKRRGTATFCPLPARIGHGQGSQRATSDQKTLADLGISKIPLSRWQKLATIPDWDFEAMFGTGQRQTTARLIAAHAPPSKVPVIPVDQNALWLWAGCWISNVMEFGF
jgi:hypothetical protein